MAGIPGKGGPRTLKGKARSRRNALKHGLTARVLTVPEHPGETAARADYVAVAVAALSPSTDAERHAAELAAGLAWVLRQALARELPAGNIAPLTRAWTSALNAYHRLREAGP